MVNWTSNPIHAEDQEGFTLIELLMVLALFSLIAFIALPSFTAYVDKSKNQAAIADIFKIESEIQRFKYSNAENPPDTLAAINMDTLLDPWGSPYQYLNHVTAKGNGKLRKDKNLVPLNSDYDLYSMGKDGQSSTPLTAEPSRDDLVRANNGDFVGLATDY